MRQLRLFPHIKIVPFKVSKALVAPAKMTFATI